MEEANVRPWSDLLSDILVLIKSKVLGRDFCSFNGVCRSWRSVPYQVPSPVRLIEPSTTLSATSQFPLLMYTGEDDSVCKFYHLSDNTTHIMDVPEIAGATIRFSKDGWLLMSQGDHAVFFVNPFTKERIDLPDLHKSYTFNGIAFLSKPTSSDCVVFGTEDHGLAGSFVLIRRGEDTWHSFTADNARFIPSHNNPVFYNGLFYCLNQDGKLGTFDPKEDDIHGWNVLASPANPCPCDLIRKNYLVECNGELLSVFEGHLGKWVKVFKLNRTSMSWQKVDSVGDEMLFVSSCTSLSVTNTKTQVTGMGNKIYYPKFQAKQSVLYSLGTGRFHSFRIEGSKENFYGMTQMMHCTWIEPSFETHSDEELRWYSDPTDSAEE